MLAVVPPLEPAPELFVPPDGTTTSGGGEEPSMGEFLQVMTGLYQSLLERLVKMDQRLVHIEESVAAPKTLQPKRRISGASVSSLPKPSNSCKKVQVREANLAMEALQLDISSLVPPSRSTKRKGTGPGTESFKLASLRRKDKDKLEKKKATTQSPDRSRSLGEDPKALNGPSVHLELPGVIVKAGSDSELSDQNQTVGWSPTSDARVLNVPGSPRPKPKPKRVGSVQSLRSEKAVRNGSLHSSLGRENSCDRSRRSSVEMRRAVSKANITEVFKLREAQLTAGLHSPSAARTDSRTEASASTVNRSPTTGVNSVKAETSLNPLNPLCSEESSVEGAEAAEADTITGEIEADDPEEEEDFSQSPWLRFSWVNSFITCWMSKFLGLVPLFHPLNSPDPRRKWLGFLKQWISMLYHWGLLILLAVHWVRVLRALALCHITDTSDASASASAEVCGATFAPMALDLGLLTGGILILLSWGGVFKYMDTTRLVAQNAAELSSYCDQTGLRGAWKSWSCKDALWTVFLWLILMVMRYFPTVMRAPEGHTFEELNQVPFRVPHTIHGVVMGLLVVAGFWQIRTSHAMLLILNWWSANLLTNQVSCIEAKQHWRRVSGLFRKTSRTFEHCFAALASMVILLALAALYDLRQGQNFQVVCGTAAVVFFIPGILWTHARTTTACMRLPSLVTLCEAEDEEEDAEYMGLAMYLSLSECGFFVWDTCVTVANVQKFLYFASALAGTIGFQTGALQLT